MLDIWRVEFGYNLFGEIVNWSVDSKEDFRVINRVKVVYFFVGFVYYLCLNIVLLWRKMKGIKNNFFRIWVNE